MNKKYSRLKLLASVTQYNGAHITILRPAKLIEKAFASAETAKNGDWYICADSAALARLAKLAALSASLKDAVVHVPLRGTSFRPYFMVSQWVPHDLLFCHHSLHLRASAWKELRRRCKFEHLKEFSVVTNMDSFPEYLASKTKKSNLLGVTVHSETIIISGSHPILTNLAASLSLAGKYSREFDGPEFYDEVINNRHGFVRKVSEAGWRIVAE